MNKDTERVRAMEDEIDRILIELTIPDRPFERISRNGLKAHLKTPEVAKAKAVITHLLAKRERESRLEEYQLGLQTGAMPEFVGKPIAQEHLTKLQAAQEGAQE